MGKGVLPKAEAVWPNAGEDPKLNAGALEAPNAEPLCAPNAEVALEPNAGALEVPKPPLDPNREPGCVTVEPKADVL